MTDLEHELLPKRPDILPDGLPKLAGAALTVYRVAWILLLPVVLAAVAADLLVIWSPTRIIEMIALLGTSAILFRRRSADTIAAMIALAFLLWVVTASSAWASMDAAPLLAVLDRIRFLLFVTAMMLFPTGRFDPAWTQFGVGAILLSFGLGVAEAVHLVPAGIHIPPTMACAALAVAAMRSRLNSLPPGVQRQQIKWVALGLGLGLLLVALSRIGSVAGRTAARALLEYQTPALTGRLGLIFADDRLADGREARSTLLVMGAARRFLNNRLELDAQTEIALGNSGESVDFPSRYRFTARYAVTSAVQLIGAYEIADGDRVDSRTLRIGFDLRPWAGARIALTANRQDITEYGPRSFAAYGLSQSVVVGPHWSLDFTVDGNRCWAGLTPPTSSIRSSPSPAAASWAAAGSPRISPPSPQARPIDAIAGAPRRAPNIATVPAAIAMASPRRRSGRWARVARSAERSTGSRRGAKAASRRAPPACRSAGRIGRPATPGRGSIDWRPARMS